MSVPADEQTRTQHFQIGDSLECCTSETSVVHLEYAFMLPGALPCSEALRVLRGHACRSSVGSSENDGHRLKPGGHVVGLRCRVDDLVDGLHGEVEGHELTDGSQASLRGTSVAC